MHQQLVNLDLTIAQMSVTLSSRADDSDRRVSEMAAGHNSTTGPFEVEQDNKPFEVLRETPGGFNFPRPDLAAQPASPSPSFAQINPNLMGGQTQSAHHEQLPQGGIFQARPDRRPIFDNKIASSDMMKYRDARKNEWLKTTQNYIFFKALEMKHDLPWAESFQSHVITDDHVRSLSTS